MNSNHIAALQNWLSTSQGDIRSILGEIMHSVNDAAEVFRTRSRPNANTIAKAKNIIMDINNYDRFLALVPGVEKKIKESLSTQMQTPLLHMLVTLYHSRFAPEFVSELQKIAESGQQDEDDEAPQPYDEQGLEKHLRNSIYNSKEGSENTLKVIREVLQNACDAADPDRHPEVTNPEVLITTHPHTEPDGTQLIDIIFHDNGIGMDWETLADKFYVVFKSGKDDDPNAAGGFGVAKALIQNASKHGWSIETNAANSPKPLHASRFHQRIYFGLKPSLRRSSGYETPTSGRKQRGTTLAEYGLPYVYDNQIAALCTTYATNGKVKIFLNGQLVVPKFTLQNLKALRDASDLPGIVAKDAAGRSSADALFKKMGDKLQDEIDKLDLGLGDTRVEFFLKEVNKSSYEFYGHVYIFVNGQYQFDEQKWVQKVDIIVSIKTTARPGTYEYPLDPGREHVRGVVADRITQVVESIKQFTEKLAQDDLFKDGIDAIMVNKDAPPMTTMDDEVIKQKKNELADAMFTDLSATIQKEKSNPSQRTEPKPESPEEPEEEPEERGETPTDYTPGGEGAVDQDKELDGTEKKIMKDIIRTSSHVTGAPPDSVQTAVIKALVQATDWNDLISQSELKQKIAEIIDGLSTPANIMIQKNFVAADFTKNNVVLTTEMLILWQKTLKLVVDAVAKHRKYSLLMSKKSFIPGLIYSSECLGLCMSAKPENGRPYACVAINAVTFAAAVNPKGLTEKIRPKSGDEAFSHMEEEKSKAADTPINRVTEMLYHISVHEVCHLLFAGIEAFHNNITFMEMICQGIIPEIRDEVKRHMRGLRKNSNKLINAIVKSRRSLNKEHHQPTKFDRYITERRTIIPEEKKQKNFHNWFNNREIKI